MTSMLGSKRRFFIRGWSAALGALALAGAIGVAMPAAAQEQRLRLITAFPLEGPVGDKLYGAKIFIQRFNERAKGKARIDVVGGPEVVSPFDQLKALQTGQFDLMLSTATYFSELRSIQFFNYIPFEKQVRLSPTTVDLLQRLSRDSSGVVFVQYSSPGNSFYLWSRNKPIRTVADAKGMKIRTFGDTTEPMFKYLGVVPTNIVSNEVYSALRSGLLDGTLRDQLSLEVLREGEHIKYGTEAKVADINSEMYMAAKSWDSLSPEVRKIMNDVARETERDGFAWISKRSADSRELIRKKYGTEIVPSDPSLRKVLEQDIPGDIIRKLVGQSKDRDEIVQKFELQQYFK